jgi:hypothetical protein
MSYGDHRLYLYDTVVDLVITTDALYVDNRPMNNRRLQAHKGVNNEIMFNIRNRDRKLQDVSDQELVVYLVNPYTRRRMLIRRLDNTAETGIVKLILTKGDIQDVEPGLYSLYVTRTTAENEDLAVYSTQNNDVKFDIEISNEAFVEPVPTQVSTTMVKVASTLTGDASNVYVSSALRGNQDKNYRYAQHTIGVYTNSFTGNIKVQASCLESVPLNDELSTDWFDISTFELADHNGIAHNTFVVNANWVRIVSYPQDDNSIVEQIALRN